MWHVGDKDPGERGGGGRVTAQGGGGPVEVYRLAQKAGRRRQGDRRQKRRQTPDPRASWRPQEESQERGSVVERQVRPKDVVV